VHSRSFLFTGTLTYDMDHAVATTSLCVVVSRPSDILFHDPQDRVLFGVVYLTLTILLTAPAPIVLHYPTTGVELVVQSTSTLRAFS
jgi:hypothetical protein